MTVLALDQGTSSTKAILVDEGGHVRSVSQVPVRRTYPRPGWVEQDPVELVESARAAIDDVLGDASATPAGLAITNQRESVVVWERATGLPLGPCVTWQCRRGDELCEELHLLGVEGTVHELTGLPLDPSFSAPKLRWLLDADPRVRAAAEIGDACAGTVDSWLVWNLTAGAVHVTDIGNASRTLLFDIEKLAWSDELLELFAIPPGCLPTPKPSSGVVGEAVAAGRLPTVPIAAVVADSHAALLGVGCRRPNTAKATFGTGTSLMTPTGSSMTVSRHGLASTVAWFREQPTYALEGNILSSGATVQWVAELLGLDPGAVEALAASVPDAGGVQLVPGFAGLGAPHWDPGARGRIEGLTFATNAGHLARAAVESIAYQVADLVDAVDLDLGLPIEELRIDGGGSRNDTLVQFQADLLDRPVLRARSGNAAALGAAYLAGIAVGLWKGEDAIDALPRRFDTFEPRPNLPREALLAQWRAALAGARTQEAPERDGVEVGRE